LTTTVVSYYPAMAVMLCTACKVFGVDMGENIAKVADVLDAGFMR
jgi:uncharacterized membrane protein YadS